jgi:hypothetical protein
MALIVKACIAAAAFAATAGGGTAYLNHQREQAKIDAEYARAQSCLQKQFNNIPCTKAEQASFDKIEALHRARDAATPPVIKGGWESLSHM